MLRGALNKVVLASYWIFSKFPYSNLGSYAAPVTG